MEGYTTDKLAIVGRNILIGVFSTLGVLIVGSAYQNRIAARDNEDKIRENLAPNALYYFGREEVFGYGKNRDVNKDGTYESVLEFVNPLTDSLEFRLVEKDSNDIRLRGYKVVDGDIVYLQD